MPHRRAVNRTFSARLNLVGMNPGLSAWAGMGDAVGVAKRKFHAKPRRPRKRRSARRQPQGAQRSQRGVGAAPGSQMPLLPSATKRTIHAGLTLHQLKTSIILIDFENVQPKDLACLRGRPFKTKVFCGATQAKIPFDLAAELQPLGLDAEYVRIQGTGRNALDFHIAYYIGRLSAECPDATFHIVSKDTGFDPLIKHLKTQGITCTRSGSLTDIATHASPAAASAPERIQKVANGLLNRKDAKPRKLKTLIAFIKCQLNNRATDAAVAEVVARLKTAGMATEADGKLTWPAT